MTPDVPDPHNWTLDATSLDGEVQSWRCIGCGSWVQKMTYGPPAPGCKIFTQHIPRPHQSGCRETVALSVHGS